MKQGWERKKLGDVATYVNGFAFKPEQWVDNGIPIIRIQNLNNPDAPYNYCDIQIPSKYIVEKGDILISWSASLGVYEWLYDKGYLNQHIFKVVFDKGDISKYYLKYAVSAKLNDMEKQLHGATMKHIVKKDFDNTLIPVPPLPEQEKIVSELDCLSGIIEKKRQQLKELDALAQSIFYEMFGDPVTNEKGWEVNELMHHVGVKGRVGWKGYKKEDLRDSGPLAIGGGHLTDNGGIDLSNPVYLSMEKYLESPEIMIEPGDLILVQRGTIGKVGLINTLIGPATINPCVLVLRPKSITGVFLLHYFLNDSTQVFLKSLIKGVAQPMITQKQVNSIPLPLPPLPLQQTFASKIEAIEKQKALIKQSLGEVETLLNARMQEYFG